MRRASSRSEGFDAPGDLVFSDAFADVFTLPEDLALTRQEHGFLGYILDGRRIRGYFEKAVVELGLEEETVK